MRRIALVVLLAFANPPALCAQATAPLAVRQVDSNTRRELEQARERVWRAWFAGDSVALDRLIPAALAAGSPDRWDGRVAALAGSRQAALSGQRLVDIRFDSTRITLRDSVAIMQARFEYALESPTGTRTTRKGTATEVFVREHGHWVNPFWYLE